jgi:type I restriction enzyme, S subunit
MDVKPGYKKTEVGVIPEEWDTRPCSALSEMITVGIVIRPAQYYVAQGVPALRSANIREAGINDSDLVFISEKSNRLLSKSQVKVGDILTVRTGYPGTSAIVPERFAGSNCIDILITRPLKTVCPEFITAWINSTHGKSQVLRDQGGLAQQHFNVGDLKNLLVALPPLPEQRAIAAALADVDALIASLDRLIAKKRDVKQAAMQQLLTGKTRLPGFSGKWEVKPLGDIFNFSGGFTASRDQLSSKGHCYLHYGDIHKSSKTFMAVAAEYEDIPKLDVPLQRVSSASLLGDGDVVFVDASEDDEGTSKHIVVINKSNIPYISGLHTIVAKAKTDELLHDYRRHCFQTRSIREQFYFYAVGTKVSGISKTNIAKITIPIPPLDEQAAIAAVLSDMDAEIATLEKRRDKTRALKQGMMQELLTGRTRLV